MRALAGLAVQSFMTPLLRPAAPDTYPHARRMLVFLHWGIGDTVMQRPILSALRRAAPRPKIVLIGSELSLQVLEDDNPPTLADQLMTYQSLGVLHYGQEGSADTDRAIRDWLNRTGPYDFIFDARHAPIAIRHALWNGGIPTIESDWEREHDVLVEGGGCQRAWIEAASDGWGIPINTGSGLRLNAPSWARWEAEAFLEEHGLSDELPIAISPIASLTLKRWPPERFAELGDRLIESTRSPLLVFSGEDPDEARDVIDRMVHQEHTVLVERRHLLETAALLQRCRAMVCNDTGLLHMAAAVGTPVVGIHGPTDPDLYRPRFPWARAVGGRHPECMHRPKDHLDLAGCWSGGECLIAEESCINLVDVDDVWNELQTLIPLSASPTGMHPSISNVAGAPPSRSPRRELRAGGGAGQTSAQRPETD